MPTNIRLQNLLDYFFLHADDILISLIESLHCNFFPENNIDVTCVIASLSFIRWFIEEIIRKCFNRDLINGNEIIPSIMMIVNARQ